MEQLQSSKGEYKNLTLEDLTKSIGDFMNQPHVKLRQQATECRELTTDEIAYYRRVFGFLIDRLGDRLFLICGAITGIGGWNQFNEALKKRAGL